ncbi:uncharacterized protein MYCFIDRAFT_33834 [Pseudocercospora fijiensis CIRAD86]|uniref:F-box domain-containing protein n=1 Tax=Pseudocercospora fijiensis (strain CIRAD86) TaxID=383855 RepID=M2YJD4_PSEFD|nr:uncharacterized protein MYCFIDRAFT_33834 [Pseudocercospora fijiensis CIRAD86]EME77840.1 hypothetical protein MYCFIDRAFT_33834 [Pseudocercospora fijiensis CIRAD86]
MSNSIAVSAPPPASSKIVPVSKDIEEGSYVIAPRKASRKAPIQDDDEPLVDLTEALALKSKKTDRKKKQQQKRLERIEKKRVKSDVKSFLELPPELLEEVLSHLRPSDIFRLLRLNRSTRDFILNHEQSISKDIIRRRYWVLYRCLQVPVALEKVDHVAQQCLLTSNWQDRLRIHTKPYQHIRAIDAKSSCTCMTCVMAWNDLCSVLDLAHFQPTLDRHEALPSIPRGSNPEWNTRLAQKHASIVEKAIRTPLHHALILQTHLASIIGTLTRPIRWGNITFAPKNMLYHLSELDVARDTDEFLERSGPPSYEPLYFREYYNHHKWAAYVPNRKWDKEALKWRYPKFGLWHAENLAWVVSRMRPEGE